MKIKIILNRKIFFLVLFLAFVCRLAIAVEEKTDMTAKDQDSTKVEKVLVVTYFKNLLSINSRGVTLKELCEEVSDKTKAEIILDKEIEGQKISVEFKDLTMKKGIEKILDLSGLKDLAISYKVIDGKSYEVSRVEIKKRDANIINYGFEGENNEKNKVQEKRRTEGEEREIKKIKKIQDKLPELLHKLKEEKSVRKKQDIISFIGESHDIKAIDPLMEIIKNDNEGNKIKNTVSKALYMISTTRWFRSSELEKKVNDAIIPGLKEIYREGDEELKKMVSDYLYLFGEKELVKPVIINRLKEGEELFYLFYYCNKIGGIQVFYSYQFLYEPKIIDGDARNILEVVVEKDFPERVRIEAAKILIQQFSEKEESFKTLVDIVENSKSKTWRIEALSVFKFIGDEKSKKVVEDALKIPELKESARMILKFEWEKK